jgi:hypothetical protein
MSYLIAGEAKAAAEIYTALPYPVTLTLTYTDGTTQNTVTAVRTLEDTGLTVLETPIAGTVANQEGEALSMTYTDSLTGENLAPPVNIAWTGRLDMGSEIRGGRNGANAIATITMDDALSGTLQYANEKFAELGLRGTSVAFSDRVAENPQTFRNIFNEGYIDVTAHGKTQAPLGASVSDTTATAELTGAMNTLRNLLPGQEVLTYAPANHVLFPGSFAENLAKSTYWAIRRGSESVTGSNNQDATGCNTLNPSDDTSFGGWYRLRQQGSGITRTAAEMNAWADGAVADSKWVIEMYHAILTDSKATADLDTKQSVANAHWAYLAQLQNGGKIWVASFQDAMKYLRERQNTTLEDIATETSRTVTLTMDTNALPPEIFNYPLTVRSQIPAEWDSEGKYIKVTQGGSVQSPLIKNEGGGLYIDYEANPLGESISLELTDELPVVTVNELKIMANGALTQDADSMVPVVFSASTRPADNTDTSEIYWYVNGVKQTGLSGGTLIFEFSSSTVGKYNIYAEDGITGLQSKTVTITLKEPGLLSYEDFEGYETGAPLQAAMEVREYPDGNKAAAVYYDSAQAYPGMHKTGAMAEGVPTVFAGRAALMDTKQAYYLELRNTADGNARKTLFNVQNGVIKADGADSIGKITRGQWLHYSVAVTPVPIGELSPVRIVLSSPHLTDNDGNNPDGAIVYETSLNLDNMALISNGGGNMVHNNNFASADANTVTYIDNIRIYNPKTAAMASPVGAVALNETAYMRLNKYIYNLEPDMVTVTDSSGETVPIGSIDFDLTNPLAVGIKFADGILAKNSVYTVHVNGAVDAMGTPVDVSADFTTSGFDPITSLSITSGGELEQETGNLSAIYFEAAFVPTAGVDISTVEWYVNGARQSDAGGAFEFTPSVTGEYTVYAKTAGTNVISNEITITVTAGAADYISITASGSLIQYDNAISQAVFTASPMPSDRFLDETSVKWFVNGVLAAEGTAEFSYTPSAKGRYNVYAAVGDGEISNILTLTVATAELSLQEYILKDNFEEHSDILGTKIDGTNAAPWSSALNSADNWAEIAADPLDSANKTLMFSYSGTTSQYPRIQKSGINIQADAPIVMSGKLYLNNYTAQSYIEFYSDASHRKEIFKLSKNGVVIVNGTALDISQVKWVNGGWIWFSLYIMPSENLSQSSMRLILSGNITGNGVIDSVLNLSSIGAGSKTVYYNNALNANSNDRIYLDDAKIYYYAPAIPVIPDSPAIGDTAFEILFSHDIDPFTLNAPAVKINGAAANGIDFNPLSPNRLNVIMADAVVSGKPYKVTFNGVKDTDGSFITQPVYFGVNTFAVTESHFETEEVKIESISENLTEITAKVTVNRFNLTQSGSVDIIIAMYDGKKLEKVWTQTVTVYGGDGEATLCIDNIQLPPEISGKNFKLFVWNNIGNSLPLTEAVPAVVE